MSQRHCTPLTRSLTAAALVLAAAQTAAAQLNDTGQITCYNASSSDGTVASGTPDPETAGFDEQDCTRGAAAADAVGVQYKVGASSVPGRDYTKIANNGSELAAGVALGTGPTDWGCTRDNVTGLIWEIKTDDNLLRDKDHTYKWYDTDTNLNGNDSGHTGFDTCNTTLMAGLCNTTAFRDAVNALTGSSRLCGATDWRLPTGKELQSLVHYGAGTGPFIDGTYYPNTINGVYWSGVNYAPDASLAWYVNFVDGRLLADVKPSNGLTVRLVRGGQ